MIRGTRLGLLRNEDIKRISVCTVNGDNLTSPALGAGSYHRCGTCGNDHLTCNGHFGHVELPHPVINVEFRAVVFKILKCVCFHCSKLLIDPNDSRLAACRACPTMKQRLTILNNLCAKVKTCGQAGVDNTAHGGTCGAPVTEWCMVHDLLVCKTTKCSPDMLFDILDYISEETATLMGFSVPDSHPRDLLTRSLLVPPIRLRTGGNSADLTNHIKQIIKLAQTSRDDNSEVWLQSDALDHYVALQNAVWSYQDSRRVTAGTYGRERQCLRSLFSGSIAKEGIIRSHVMGKRVNQSGRTVISPSDNLMVNQVGVPKSMCANLTRQVSVNRINLVDLMRTVYRGPVGPDGANYIERDGKLIDLSVVDRSAIKLQYGDKVQRHLREGDYVLINRQPSLHKFSMLAARVVPVDHKTIQLHVCVTPALNADFDGDEANLHVMTTTESHAEAVMLMDVKQNIMKNGTPVIRFTQHSVLCAYMLTREGSDPLTREEVMQAVTQHQWADMSHVLSILGTRLVFSGRDLISCLFWPALNFQNRDVNIEHGVLRSGTLRKSHLNKLLKHVYINFGPDQCNEFISGACAVFDHTLTLIGCSIGMDDYKYHQTPEEEQVIERTQSFAAEYNVPVCTTKAQFKIEHFVLEVLDRARDHLASTIDTKCIKSGLYHIIESGAKGNKSNLVQAIGLLGQQLNHECKRMQTITTHDVGLAEGRGFVRHSFFAGLDPVEFFAHMIGVRVGLVDTAAKVSETGYSHRRVSKMLEDVVVQHDHTVRNGKHIVQFLYGNDGLGTEMSYQTTVPKSTATRGPGTDSIHIRIHQLLDSYVPLHCQLPFDLNTLHKHLQSLNPSKEPQEATISKLSKLFRTHRATPAQQLCILNTLGQYAPLPNIDHLIAYMHQAWVRVAVPPGENVGMSAAQSISEPITQMTLNRFHSSGQFSGLVSGMPRFKDLINVPVSASTSMRVYVTGSEDAHVIGSNLLETTLAYIVERWHAHVPDPYVHLVEPADNCVFMHLDITRLKERNITTYDVVKRLCTTKGIYPEMVTCGYNWLCIDDKCPSFWAKIQEKNKSMRSVIGAIVVSGMNSITDFFVDKDGTIVTEGCDFEATSLMLPHHHVESGSVHEMMTMLGIDIARNYIVQELSRVLSATCDSVTDKHLALLADQMCHTGIVNGTTFKGIRNSTKSTWKRASFEQSLDCILEGACTSQSGNSTTVVEAMMMNQRIPCGTGTVHCLRNNTGTCRHVPVPDYMHSANLSRYMQPSSLPVSNKRHREETSTDHVHVRFATKGQGFVPSNARKQSQVVQFTNRAGARFHPSGL